MTHTYKIDTDGSVLIFIDGVKEPSIHQPHWPDGTAWADGEAQAWAEQYILAAEDPTADFAGNNPANPTIPRPAPVAPTK